MKCYIYILITLFFIQCRSQLCERDQKLVEARDDCLNTGYLRSGSRRFTTKVGSDLSCFDCVGNEECLACEQHWQLQCSGNSQSLTPIRGCDFLNDEIWSEDDDDLDMIDSMATDYAGGELSFGCSYTSPYGMQAGMIVVGFAGFCLLCIAFFGYLSSKLGLDCRRVKDKYGDLRAKFLLGEVHLIATINDGKAEWSFWKSYFVMLSCTAPILGMWFISKSHFSSRLDKTVVMLFSVSYGMLAELVVVLYPKLLHPSYIFKLLVVTIPNAVVWNKLSERFDREGEIVDYRRAEQKWPETEEGIAASNCDTNTMKDRAKNAFFVIFSLALCVISFIKLQEESNPKCFVVNFLFNAIIMAFLIQAGKMFLDFYCKWYCMITHHDTLGKGSLPRLYLDIAASLPPSADLHPIRLEPKDPSFLQKTLAAIKGCLCWCCLSGSKKNPAQELRNEVIQHMKERSFKSIKEPHNDQGALAEGKAFDLGLKIIGAAKALDVLEDNLKRLPGFDSSDECTDDLKKDSQKIAKLFDDMDLNGDGVVSKKELLKALQDADEDAELVMGDDLKAAFKDIDLDGNEMLSKEEFMQLLPHLGTQRKQDLSGTRLIAESPDSESVLDVKSETPRTKEWLEQHKEVSE